MNKLRLLLWKDCNCNCSGCCNKDWDLDNLPIADYNDFKYYDQILLTGGEPLLYPNKVINIVNIIRRLSNAKIYLYTAKVDNPVISMSILEIVDGFCVTLHNNSDINPFVIFNHNINYYKYHYSKIKSLRLNVFSNVNYGGFEDLLWKVKTNIEWIKDCPLPQDEVFMRLHNDNQ